MDIAMLAPVWERVPPPAYGGIELVVSLLTEALVARGHRVTLFATGDSVTRAHLSAVQDKPLRQSGVAPADGAPFEIVHVDACFRRAHEFDLIHNHCSFQGVANARYVDTPVLTTLHGYFSELNRPFFAHFRDVPYVSISHAQRQGAPAGMRFVGTVYNGIDTRGFRPGPKGGYLLNLGRISPEKGTHVAIEVAKRAGWPLVIAAKIDPVDRAYYEAQVRPHLDGERVIYVGEVGGTRKAELLAGAEALLHPVQWPEPFGLVMAEAMASGTPVVGTPMGALPEVVEPGVTGFLAADVEGLVAAIALARDLDGDSCRRRAIERFDAGRMADDYVQVYEQLVAGRVSITWAPDSAARLPFNP